MGVWTIMPTKSYINYMNECFVMKAFLIAMLAMMAKHQYGTVKFAYIHINIKVNKLDYPEIKFFT